MDLNRSVERTLRGKFALTGGEGAPYTTRFLMGDDVMSRKDFITTNARDVRNLDF